MNFPEQKYFSLQTLFLASFKTIGYLFIIITIGLLLDSSFFNIENGQELAVIGAIMAFLVMFFRSTKRLREQMLYAVVIGFVGEHLFSIIFEMYTYRLGNVPIYVPFGHAILFRVVVHFCKNPAVIFYKKQIEKFLGIFILIYASLFLAFANDLFGFIMSMLVLLLMSFRPKDRLFYFTMYLVVAYLEIIGTRYQCWSWPKTFCNLVSFLKSANPPSGISLLYFLLDLSSLWCYKLRHFLVLRQKIKLRSMRII